MMECVIHMQLTIEIDLINTCKPIITLPMLFSGRINEYLRVSNIYEEHNCECGDANNQHN